MNSDSRKRSYRYIIALAATAAIAAAAFFGYRAYQHEYLSVLDGFEQETLAHTADVDKLFDDMVRVFDAECSVFEEFLAGKERADAEITTYLEMRTRMLSTSVDPNYIDLYCSRRGKYLCGNYWHPPAGYDARVRPWYLGAVEARGETAVVPPYKPADYPFGMMAVTRKLKHPDTVFALDVQLAAFDPIAGNGPNGKAGLEFFFAPDGSVISSSGKVFGDGRDLKPVISAVRAVKHGCGPFVFGGEYVFHGHTRCGWTVVRLQPRSDIEHPAWWSALDPVIYSCLCFLLVFLLIEILSLNGDRKVFHLPEFSRKGQIFRIALTLALVGSIFTLLWFGQDRIVELEYAGALSDAEEYISKAVKKYVAFIETARGAAGYCSRHIDRAMRDGADREALAAETKKLMDLYRSLPGRNYRTVYVARPDWYIESAGWTPPADYRPDQRRYYLDAIANPHVNCCTPPYSSLNCETDIVTISRATGDDLKTVVGIDISVKMLQTLLRNIRMDGARCVMVLASNGYVLEHHTVGRESYANHDANMEIIKERVLEKGESFRYISTEGEELQIVAVPMAVGGYVVVTGDTHMFDAVVSGYRGRTLFAFAFLFISGILAIAAALRRVRSQREREIVLFERARQSDARAEALDSAEAANRAKTTFLSNMSHDIRTPMNAIIGYTNLASAHLDAIDRVREYLAKISQSGDHLLTIIDDVLDMSRVESGRLTIDPQPENLEELVSAIRDMVFADVTAKAQSFTAECDALRHPHVLCDRMRLNRVILNVLSNAIKYTDAGGEISLRVEEPADGRYRFTVKDNGCGMDEEFLQKIYEPFERAQTSTISGVQGTGLGMSITKSIVDLMHGEIRIASRPGEGTTVTVELPFEMQKGEKCNEYGACPHAPGGRDGRSTGEPSPESEKLKSAEETSSRPILLVEDNAINREIAVTLLKESGFEVETAVNGAEAVEMVKRRGGSFELVLMDIQMPVMNGYEATRAIRALEAAEPERRRLPVVAMTANAFAEDRAAALDSGMDDHITKPVNLKILLETIKRCTGGNEHGK